MELPPPDSAPLSIDLYLHEAPQPIIVEELQPQEEFPSVAAVAQGEVAEAPRPVRRRQPRQRHISQEEARRTIVELGKSRLKLEEKQTEAIQKQTEILQQMVHTLNKIADK